MSTPEVWRDVAAFEGRYKVSNLGRVWSARIGRPLKPGRAANGYLTVALGRGQTKCVHALVAEAFIGPRPKGADVCHGDGTRTNNVASNLAYGTRSENNRQRAGHGRVKFNNEVIHLVRLLRLLGDTYEAIKRQTGVGISQISNIVNGRQRA